MKQFAAARFQKTAGLALIGGISAIGILAISHQDACTIYGTKETFLGSIYCTIGMSAFGGIVGWITGRHWDKE